MKPFQNYDNPPMHVSFYLLKQFDEVSHFRNECPVCGDNNDGLLAMQRDNNGELMAEDCCLLCGQHFIYDDIKLVRWAKGW